MGEMTFEEYGQQEDRIEERTQSINRLDDTKLALLALRTILLPQGAIDAIELAALRKVLTNRVSYLAK